MANKLIFIDCDSTLSSIEGIDELARLRGETTFRECEAMTNRAMDGEIALEDVYGARLELIRPTAAECKLMGERYIETVEPTAKFFIDEARKLGWKLIIVSGGITQVIQPFADFLGISDVRAVDLHFDGNGQYAGFDGSCPTSRMGGKIEIIESDRKAFQASKVVMVGDGSSDLETQPYVDLFVGYGGFIERATVKEQAREYVYQLKSILELL